MKKIFIWICLILFVIVGCTAHNKKEITLNIATYNLRMDTPRDSGNAWVHRKDMVKGLIRFHDFDIVGTQEAFKHQLDDLLELENFAYIGVGRDDGIHAGEHSAIFYKTDKFEVLQHGDFWFSETPDVPSKGWDARCCNRICSWAKFREKASGKEFFVFNVHYDHEGVEARRNSSLMFLERIEEIAGDKPVFALGDFNATPEQEPIQIITNNGWLFDSFDITQQPPYGTIGTFNGFRIDHPMIKSRIDYIFVTEGITVNKYGVLNDIHYGRFPSDHFPVMIQVTF
ncbi:MAG: endonuclease/exonuclease/phosphatase family protein [Dysgonamonadaceae bacterium]|jgi:endonuclease/exonuclease/phosphatase family metal-dependent hydrolase|nr:endonuclease/exonuclease/phosphatase family protein [Dysgonamonadaceae bacterium]